MDKRRKYLIIFTIFILFLAPLFIGFQKFKPVTTKNSDVNLNIKTDPTISITTEYQLMMANMSAGADGTQGNPYIIANKTIDANGGYGIHVYNTESYFIIENCTIYNGTKGINFKYVENGTMRNNTIYNMKATAQYNGTGIFLTTYCHNNTITNNTIYNCNSGNFIYSGNGISILGLSENCTVTNNTIYNNTGGSGYRSGNGILTSAADFIRIINNTCYNNTSGGGDYSGNGINVDSGENSTLANNTVHNNTGTGLYSGNGILFRSTDDSHIIFNTVNDNEKYGIYLVGSDDNNISYNTIHDNLGGIFEDTSSHGNTKIGNDIKNRQSGSLDDNPFDIIIIVIIAISVFAAVGVVGLIIYKRRR